MPFDADFLDVMSTIVTYEPWESNDLYGSPTFGTVIYIPCHVTYKRIKTRGDAIEEAVSTAQIQCPPPGFIWTPQTPDSVIPKIKTNDRIVFPFDNIERKVLSVTFYTDNGDAIGSGFTSADDGNQVHHQSVALT